MVLIYNQKYDYCMFYVPKAACSFMRALYIDVHKSEFDSEQLSFISKRGIHVLNNIQNNNINAEKLYNTKRFIVCRNPYTRCLSSFYDKFLNCFNKNNILTPTKLKLQFLYQLYYNEYNIDLLKKFESDTIYTEEYNSVEKFICTQHFNLKIHPFTFKNYLVFLQNCVQTNINAFDVHHNLQTFTVENHNKQTLFKDMQIVQIENFEDNIKDMCKVFFNKTLTNIFLKTFNKHLTHSVHKNSTPLKQFINSDCFNWDQEKILDFYNTKQYLPNIDCMLDNECIRIINETYNDDFEFLKYEKQ